MSVAILLTPNLCDRRDVRANRIYVDTNFKYHKTRKVPATRSARHFFIEIAGVPFNNSTSQYVTIVCEPRATTLQLHDTIQHIANDPSVDETVAGRQ